MQPEDLANLATAVALFLTSVILIALAVMIKKPNKEYLQRGVGITRTSTILLGVFLLVHSFYHVSEFIGNDFFSDDIIEPASILLLLAFSIYVKTHVFVPRSPKSQKEILTKKVIAEDSSSRVIPLVFAIPLLMMSLSFFTTDNVAELFSMGGILASVAMFGWMALKNPSPSSLHFQFAIIVLVWAAAEIPQGLSTLGFLSLGGVDTYGTWVHFVSMALIGAFICLRTLRIVLFSPKIDPNFIK